LLFDSKGREFRVIDLRRKPDPKTKITITTGMIAYFREVLGMSRFMKEKSFSMDFGKNMPVFLMYVS
jgi:hypothetical protein